MKNILVARSKMAQITCGFFIETKFEVTPGGKKIDKSIVHWFDKNPKLDLMISEINNIPKDRKIILWSRYTAGVKMISDKIGKAFGLDSFTTAYANDDAFAQVEKFEKNDNMRFLIANQKKAGTGLNIQFSNYQMYFANDFSYFARQQAEDRQHRQGQKDTVTIIDALCKKSIDEEIYKVIKEKKELDDSLNSLARVVGL